MLPKGFEEPPINEKLEALDAYLDYFEISSEAALNRLIGKNDPESILRRLLILHDTKKTEEAVKLIQDLPPHKRWAEIGIQCLVECGNLAQARTLLKWAKGGREAALTRRCELAFGNTLFVYALRNRKNHRVIPGSLTVEEDELLEEVVTTLSWIVRSVEEKGAPDSELELIAVDLTFKVQVCRNDRQQAESLSRYLIMKKPILLSVAGAVLYKVIKGPENIVDRLRCEHAESFRAQALAILIESNILGLPEAAFQNALFLYERVKGEEQRELLDLLLELAQATNHETYESFQKLLASLDSPEGENVRNIARAQLYLKQGAHEKLKLLLDGVPNNTDTNWLQIRGYYFSEVGKVDEGLELLHKAADELNNPDLYRRISAIALRHNRYSSSLKALEAALKLQPKHENTLLQFAKVSVEAQAFGQAAEAYRGLTRINPDNKEFLLNLAIALSRSNQAHEALEVYNKACTTEDLLLSAWIGRALLLKSINRAPDAFSSLAPIKELFLSNLDYLMAYMDVAYASNHDSEGDFALRNILEIQKVDKSRPKVVREVSEADMKALLQHRSDQAETLFHWTLQGRAPWLIVENSFGNPSYLGWSVRTQPLDLLWDEPRYRTRFTLYSTNGFTLSKSEGTTILRSISAPLRNSRVIIDLSALITLHHLKLLNQVSHYFEKIFVPSQYFSLVLHESAALSGVQRSMKDATFFLRSEIQSKRIRVAANENSFPIVGLDSMDVSADFNVSDIVYSLFRHGSLTNTQYHRILTNSITSSLQLIRAGQEVLFTKSALVRIFQCGVLENTVRLFGVYVSEEVQHEVNATIRGYELQDNTFDSHNDLWGLVRNNSRFDTYVSNASRTGTKDVFLSSVYAAQESGMPLFADDRVLQALVLNHNLVKAFAAFGTDVLLQPLFDAGLIREEDYIKSFMELFRRRYKFIVPPTGVLMSLARQHAGSLPGASLRQVCLYTHSCFTDPGLFGGAEGTSQPISMAIQLYQEWIRRIMDFVLSVWNDCRFSDNDSQTLTRWAIKEWLPPLPPGIGGSFVGIEGLTNRMVLGGAFLAFLHSTPSPRTQAALASIRVELGLSEAEYVTLVSEVLHVIGK